MSLVSLKDLYVAELADLHDAESQALTVLPRLAEAARAPELCQLLVKHADESRLHLERLQLIFTRLGERAEGQRSLGVSGIVQETDERLNQPATDDARDAGIIGMVQRVEHYEIAAYGCARTYARRLNRPDEARLLQETLEEERRTDRRLTEMAEAHINDDARTEADLHQLARPKKLRFVDVRQLDFSRLTDHGSIEVRNDTDVTLGSFDGLVVDADVNRPHYVVVDSGAFLVGRRYLLPVSEVRFDQADRVLRVALPKDVASRYPSFDPEEFGRMDERTLRGYESRLLTFFGREARPMSDEDEYTPPEWLLTGIWIPMAGERVGPETRGFANEFLPDREHAVAREEAGRSGEGSRPTTEHDTPTPPHGEKLRG